MDTCVDHFSCKHQHQQHQQVMSSCGARADISLGCSGAPLIIVCGAAPVEPDAKSHAATCALCRRRRRRRIDTCACLQIWRRRIHFARPGFVRGQQQQCAHTHTQSNLSLWPPHSTQHTTHKTQRTRATLAANLIRALVAAAVATRTKARHSRTRSRRCAQHFRALQATLRALGQRCD